MKSGLFLSVIACIALIAGCGSSGAKVGKSWVEKDIAEKNLHGVLVVAMAESAEGRKAFERDLTAALKKHNVHAVASSDLRGGSGKKIDKEAVVAMAGEAGVDTALVTLFAGRDQSEVLHPGRKYYAYAPVYGRDYHGRGRVYGVPYQVGQTSDFWAQHKSLFLEANLYEIKTEELLWRASSGMEEQGDIDSMRASFIDSFMQDLSEKGLVD